MGLRPAVETVSLALGRGICIASDALWFISRGVVIEELDRGVLVELPAGARFLSGAVGMTRQQTATAPGLAALEEVARRLPASRRQIPPPGGRAIGCGRGGGM